MQPQGKNPLQKIDTITKQIPSQLRDVDLQVQLVDFKEAFGGPRPITKMAMSPSPKATKAVADIQAAPQSSPGPDQSPDVVTSRPSVFFGLRRVVSRMVRGADRTEAGYSRMKKRHRHHRRQRHHHRNRTAAAAAVASTTEDSSTVDNGKQPPLRIESFRPKTINTPVRFMRPSPQPQPQQQQQQQIKYQNQHDSTEEQSIFIRAMPPSPGQQQPQPDQEYSTIYKVQTMFRDIFKMGARQQPSPAQSPLPPQPFSTDIPPPITTMEPTIPGDSNANSIQLKKVVMKNGIPKSLHDAIEAFLSTLK